MCSWIDRLVVMLDANFRLKCKYRAIKDDPPMGSGLSYYVKEGPYTEWIASQPEQTEVRALLPLSWISIISFRPTSVIRDYMP